MGSPSAERYLSAALLNKSLRERLCDVDALVDAITDYAIVQLDVNGTVIRWCPGAQASMGYSAAEVVDQPVSMFYTEEDRAAGLAERELAAASESGRFEFEGWRVRKDRQRFRAGVVLKPCFMVCWSRLRTRWSSSRRMGASCSRMPKPTRCSAIGARP
jgi:two-component system, NarL family, sensor histidine kinase DevS